MKPIYKIEAKQIHISNGNHKLGRGLYNINLLPGDGPIVKKDGTVLTSVKGTCNGVCAGCKNHCYAMRDTIMHHNSCVPAQGENTKLAMENRSEYFYQLFNFLHKNQNKIKVFRFHSSGEIPDFDYFSKMNSLAELFPKIHFYCYTKRFNILEEYRKRFGEGAKNLVVNCSEWNGNTKQYNLKGYNFFVWDDGTDPEIAKLPHCRAVSAPTHPGGKGHSTGVKCINCGLCWRKNDGHRIAVYNH